MEIYKSVLMAIIGLIVVALPIHGFAFAASPDPASPLFECESKIWPKYATLNSGTVPFAGFLNNTLCLQGNITIEGANDAIEILAKHNIERILIISPGGDAFAALRIAMQMLKSHVDVYVSEICASSCANYIFLAANQKFILKDSVVAWHGAPFVQPSDSADFRNLWELHKSFFGLIGVDDRVTYDIPCDVLKNRDYLEALNKGKHPAWTYKKDIMIKKFYISNVHMGWEPQSDEELRAVPEWGDVFQDVYLSQGVQC